MDSVLNVAVSCTPDYFHPEKLVTINLLTWLQSMKYAEKVMGIRKLKNKADRDELKAHLPAILTFGVFSIRSIDKLISCSRLMCIDIDEKDNTHISNYTDLKAVLCKIKNIAYIGLSVSGTGYFVLIAIANPEKHAEYFDYVMKYFSRIGIKVDERCRDITRLRGASYDPDAYYNHFAVPLTKYYVGPARSKMLLTNNFRKIQSNSNKDRQTIEGIIEQVQRRSIDITGSYSDWLGIGCDIAATFGTDGEDYFLLLSQYYPGDNPQKDIVQYKACLKAMLGKPSSFGAVVNAAKKHGIIITQNKNTLSKVKSETRFFYQGVKRMEVLKTGRLIEVTPEPNVYPTAWDRQKN